MPRAHGRPKNQLRAASFHIDAFSLWFSNLSDQETAKAVGVSRNTILSWKRREEWEDSAQKIGEIALKGLQGKFGNSLATVGQQQAELAGVIREAVAQKLSDARDAETSKIKIGTMELGRLATILKMAAEIERKALGAERLDQAMIEDEDRYVIGQALVWDMPPMQCQGQITVGEPLPLTLVQPEH